MKYNTAKIDKNVPRPTDRRRYPWRRLKVGESFLAADRKLSNVNTTRIWAEKRTGYRFIGRTVKGGVRYWRVS